MCKALWSVASRDGPFNYSPILQSASSRRTHPYVRGPNSAIARECHVHRFMTLIEYDACSWEGCRCIDRPTSEQRK
eukprot:scaffold222351_cov22-Tisochrysis_lutea.AAC.1